MHLLITNDDGIYAKGIRALANHLSKTNKVTVVAPDRQQSATSHAITLHKPLHVERVNLGDETVTAYHANGTPADCVKLALGALCDEPPEGRYRVHAEQEWSESVHPRFPHTP